MRMSKAADRLDLLQTFVRIAETGSLSAASRALGLAQPTVSRQLAQLESLMGVRLAQRSTSEFSLTEAGRTLLREARALLDRWQAIGENLQKGAEAPAGDLRVVATLGLGQQVLVDVAAAFMAKYPDVRIEWILTDRQIDLVEQGADCWLHVGPIRDESLVVREIGRIKRICVATPSFIKQMGRPRSPVALSKLPCVALAPYMGRKLALYGARGAETEVDLTPVFTTDTFFAADRAVRRGIGFGLMPTWYIADDLKSGRLVDLLPGWTAKPIGLYCAYSASRYRPARVNLFIDHMRESIGRQPELALLQR
jgi:DNA-binding transcriptional LysR family regulator